MKNKKKLRGFSYSKNMANFEGLGHFIKHKPLISEECQAYSQEVCYLNSDIALTLARTCPTSPKLSMFLVQTRNANSTLTGRQLNEIELVNLKNKLGTRQLPTAELVMKGSRGIMISEEGRGVPTIASMFTISRLHNIISSVAIQR